MSTQLASVSELALNAAPAFQYNRYLLNVEFEGPGGEEWSSVGGGETVRDAIDSARDALPTGVDWDLVRWNDLWGE
jgi:hypothetical protein